MKYVLLGAFVALTIVSFVGVWTKADARADGPLLYWSTDPNPARVQQIEAFGDWLVANGHPRFTLKTDSANNDPAKKVIQGVSGVLADVVDLAGNDMPYFVELGLFADVTDDARRLGFDPSHTYPAARPLIERDGRQYRFPCNVSVSAYWINRATFAAAGVAPPPGEWTIDDFERLGRAYVAAANPTGTRVTRFFADSVDLTPLRRSVGLDRFNETLTRCTLDDPRQVALLERVHRWTHVDHLLPSAAEAESFASDAGYGNAAPQLFRAGQYAMLWSGRHMLIQFRQFGALDLAVSRPPHGGFANAVVAARGSGVYAGGGRKDLATLFLSYLASPEYNRQIIDDADGLPPDPRAAETEAFLRPAKHPNEWNVHAPWAAIARDVGIVDSASPYVLPSVAARLERNAYDGFMRSGRLDARASATAAARTINDEIDRGLREDPKLAARHAAATKRQAEIDALRAANKPVPLAWIENPFHRAYYVANGWAAE